MKNRKSALSFIARILSRTIRRLSPFCTPVIPAQVTLWVIAAGFTILWLRDRILCTFIPEYRELALSAWGFLLLMNFLESFAEEIHHEDDEE